MEFFHHPKKLYGTALGLFLLLTYYVAIRPALENQNNNHPLPNAITLSEEAMEGKKIFIANGCVACHTQQVRNVEMDQVWGARPGIPADYASISRTNLWTNTATLMGTERTGPDLTDVGTRQPSLEWNLLHLYQPRAVVKASIMPAYPWLFEEKDQLEAGDKEIRIPSAYAPKNGKHVVASKKALQLVAYLQSLKQTPLPGSMAPEPFLYPQDKEPEVSANQEKLPDGISLYAKNCAACHQSNGEGLPGAFPPLKGSPIVLGEDLDLFVSIIMLGYDAREEFAVMSAVGTNNKLQPEEVTAIINHERNSWGNNAKPVSKEEVKKIMDYIAQSSKP
ncbi:MAG: cytochrome c [Bacteroidota bacterium]|nr:cytochrome c [Bacteroidota bacterium]MDX5429787.1 cytochrome c [Bacteroidota bacterium]MDX5468566.1 cytochrome c [Bacteroidota bacterium]